MYVIVPVFIYVTFFLSHVLVH